MIKLWKVWTQESFQKEVEFDRPGERDLTVLFTVTVNDNSPIQDYVHPEDQTQPTFKMW